MENKQDIGKAFKDRLAGLNREPGDAVWQGINTQLKQQKRGFSMPFWGKATTVILGVVAVLVFTYPQWDEYMPQVIIKMPGEKQPVINLNPDETTGSSSVPTDNTATPVTATPSTQNSSATSSQTGIAANAVGNNAVGNNAVDNNVGMGNKTVDSRNAKSTVPTTQKAGTITQSTIAGTNNITAKKSATARKTQKQFSSNANTVAATSGTKTKKSKANTASATVVNPTNTNKGTVAANATINQEAVATPQNQASQTDVATATPQNSTINRNTQRTFAGGNTPNAKDGNMRYSAGIFPTVSQSVVDSLLVAQKEADIKKSKERTFASNEYALQDNLTGGEGNRHDFYVFALVAPTNYKFGESKSLIDASLNNRGSSAETAYNYGAYIGYEFTNQFSVRAGISKVGIRQRTGNVALEGNYSGVNYVDGVTNTSVNAALGNTAVTLRQETSFIEVPIEATYALFGTRADLYFKGGMSLFYLGDNELYAENSQGSLLMGSLNRANDFSVSGNAGFGFYYKFLRELQMNVEPGVKYYFNTFEGVTPFSLYVQAGLLYRF